MIYGYCRISTPKQSIERQVRNIKSDYPDAVIFQEIFTGTRVNDRKRWNQLVKKLRTGDTVVFDSVSRMSRNAEEGFGMYQDLYSKNIDLIFLKEPHINTSVYKKAIENNHISMTGTKADIIIDAVNKFLLELAKEQIFIAFEQAEKEVSDLHRRTKEGIETARLNGKQIGQRQGAKLKTKKSIKAKEFIRKYNLNFGGYLNNEETYKLIGISRNSFYKYKKEIIEELNNDEK